MKKVIILLTIIDILFIIEFLDNTYFYNNIEKLKVKDTNYYNKYFNVIIDEDINKLVNKYSDLKELIKRANITIPIKDFMVPQGISIIDNYILISSYDSKRVNYSIISILDQYGGLVNTVSLDNYSHVGALAYDKINKMLYVPGEDGILDIYDLGNLKYKLSINDISDELIDYQDKNKRNIDYLFIDEDILYIGSFGVKEHKGIVKKFRIIKKDDLIILENINSFVVPSLVQSINIYEIRDKKYLILSRSYGQEKASHIEIYEYKDNISSYDKPLLDIKMPPMLEQITIDKDNLYLLFESNAQKYDKCIDVVDDIIILDLEKIISKLEY